MVTSDLRQIENEIILDKFDSSAFYVMVKKGNTALLEKVNHAIVLLNSDYPSWKSMLAYKYYNKSSGGKEIVLTADEQSYLNELHAKGKTVRVLINPGIKPYSYFVAHKPKRNHGRYYRRGLQKSVEFPMKSWKRRIRQSTMRR